MTFYREGVALGVSAALRVASEMSWIAALMLTTPFPRLLDALQFYRLPPVLIGAFGMAYRYAFLLADECYRMIAASRVRGGLNSFYRKIESLAMIVAQVIIRAYDRAARLQLAMMTRGADFADAGSRMVASVIRRGPEAPSPSPDGPLQLPDAFYWNFTCGVRLGNTGTSDSPTSGAPLAKSRISPYRSRVGRWLRCAAPMVAVNRPFLKLVAEVFVKTAVGRSALPAGHSIKPTATKLSGFCGLLFQDPNDQVFCTHVREDIAYGPRNLGLDHPTIDSVVESRPRWRSRRSAISASVPCISSASES